MSPNLEDQMPDSPDFESPNEHIHLTLTPLSDLSASTSISDEHQSVDSGLNEEVLLEEQVEVAVISELRNYVPLEHNIRELLVRVSNTEHLETVTQIKLRVIARELALQQLGNYLPALRELILDGSIISSLRDLGYGLRNLKILKVNRCQLTCIDGVLGFEYLEELYAADNSIKDLFPCAFLSNLKVLDVRRNSIKHFGSLNFLNLCPDLNHLLLEGNMATETLSGYQNTVGRILPHLILLDGETLTRDLRTSLLESIDVEDVEQNEDYGDDDDNNDGNNEPQNVDILERMMFSASRLANLSRSSPRNQDEPNSFTVCFPPRVCGSNGTTNGKSS